MFWLVVGKSALIMEPQSVVMEDVSLNLDLIGVNDYCLKAGGGNMLRRDKGHRYYLCMAV